MAQQIINIGNSPNDGTGDTLRAGGKKINENFTEVYSLLNNKVEFITIFSNGATSDFDLIKDYINTNGIQVDKDTILKFIITKLKTSSSGSSGSIFGAVEEKFYQWKPGAGNFGTPFGDTITTARWQLVSVVTYLSTSSHDLGEIGTTNIEDAVNSSGPYDIPPNIFTAERNGEQNVYMYIGNATEIGLGATQTAADDFVDLTDEDPAPPDLTDYVTYGVFNGSLYDTAETGFSTDLSNFTSLTEKFYFLRISGEGDTVYFASKDDNVEDFVGSRIYISATGTKHDLGSPTVTQNGYNFWDIGVLPVTINPSTEEWAFQVWFDPETDDLQQVTDKGNTTDNSILLKGADGIAYGIQNASGDELAKLHNKSDEGTLLLRKLAGTLEALYTAEGISLDGTNFMLFPTITQNETFAMLSDLAMDIEFDPLNESILVLKDAEGNNLGSVNFGIQNIQGLQSALDGKQVKLTTDESLFIDPLTNEIRSNIAQITETFVFAASKTFTLTNDSVDVIDVFVNRSNKLFLLEDYTLNSVSEIEINAAYPLQAGDKIRIKYNYIITI